MDGNRIIAKQQHRHRHRQLNNTTHILWARPLRWDFTDVVLHDWIPTDHKHSPSDAGSGFRGFGCWGRWDDGGVVPVVSDEEIHPRQYISKL